MNLPNDLWIYIFQQTNTIKSAYNLYYALPQSIQKENKKIKICGRKY